MDGKPFIVRRDQEPECVTPPPRECPSAQGLSPILTPDVTRTPPTPRTPDLGLQNLSLEEKPPRPPIVKPSLLGMALSGEGSAHSLGGELLIAPLAPGASSSGPTRKRRHVPRVFIPLPDGSRLRMTVAQAANLGMLPPRCIKPEVSSPELPAKKRKTD